MQRARSTGAIRGVVNVLQLGFTRLDLVLHRHLGRSLGGSIAHAPVLVLITTGRTSGKRRQIPLVYLEDGHVFLDVAAYGGSPWNPHWLANLRAHPGAEIEIGGRSIAVSSQILTGDERASLLPRVRHQIATFRAAERRTDREIPLIRLTPASARSEYA